MKGRPPNSQIRQNMIEILYHLKSAYGYQISKEYHKIFGSATRRVIYYHLKKGLSLEEFEIDRIEQEKGEFSWGNMAEKIYYKLGKRAEPRGNKKVERMLGK